MNLDNAEYSYLTRHQPQLYTTDLMQIHGYNIRNGRNSPLPPQER